MNSADGASLLRIARDVATEVGRFLIDSRPDDLATQTKSSPTDVVTAMDQAAERRVGELLERLRPGDGLMGEEGSSTATSTGVTWIVDPIDGTTNYLYRLPLWSISLAAVVNGAPVAGCVYLPAFDLRYEAAHGRGSKVVSSAGERELQCAQTPDIEHALVATGFGYASERRTRQGQVVVGLLPTIRDIRRSGAASVDLCWVAEGTIDAYYENGLHPWDIAAGMLIATEAGARVGLVNGGPIEPLDAWVGELPTMLTSSPQIFDPLTDVLHGLGVE